MKFFLFLYLYGVIDFDVIGFFVFFVEILNWYNFLYLMGVEVSGCGDEELVESLWFMRKVFKGIFFIGVSVGVEEGYEVVRNGKVDMVVYGRLFFVNLDLVKRFVLNVLLNDYNRDIFYL